LTFLFALNNTIIAGIQPVISTHFNAVGKLNWLSIAFLTSATPTNLVWARIYKQFNTKWTYILYITLFKVGSVTCGAAPSMAVLIIRRAICGLGGSGMYVGAMALLAIITTMYKRPIYLGGTGLT
jgi:MFS family permease